MSAGEPGGAPAGDRPQQAAAPADKAAPDGSPPPDQEGAAEESPQAQEAWTARRDLMDHAPRNMRFESGARLGGGLIGGDNHGVSAGRVAGDVIKGSKTEIHYQFGSLFGTGSHSSGEISRTSVEAVAAHFVTAGTVPHAEPQTCEDAFRLLAERLREERVLVLLGPRFAGRGTAALMLLHRLEAFPVNAIDRESRPGDVAGRLKEGGNLLCDPITERGRPLRESDLLAMRDELAKKDAYLVITVGPRASLEDVPVAEWHAPAAYAVLEAHLRTRIEAEQVPGLLALPAVTEFLDRAPQPREAVAYARTLAEYATGQAGGPQIERFSLSALENQIQEWFEEDESALHLRDKAFLVALAAFDGSPYALTAELSDLLYAFLQQTENPVVPPAVPVFGTHVGKRLQLARAHRYEEEEPTEWGPVLQAKSAFRDDRAPLVLLRELWTGHPSSRPALIQWLHRLAVDGRPLVRTRAASTVAVLAVTDLPSAMALIIEPWAASKDFVHRIVAVNALALAHRLEAPHVPYIIDTWCEGDDPGRRWVAIRAHGLIGDERPEKALAALRKAARKEYEEEDRDDDLLAELASSVELLVLSPAGEQVLQELLRSLDTPRKEASVLDLAVAGFLNACWRTEGDKLHGRPLILARYAEAATAGDRTARNIAVLWRTALAAPVHSRTALDVLRTWVLIADRDPAVEWALAALLPVLAVTPEDFLRLDHLLRTMSDEDAGPPPPVAGRLRTVLPHQPA
ncbi:hypothetical protein GCM10010329_06660 [Streptomyces spiroverticillatus]|uniref:HEAT repeat domain-containing protein n=1 Tax=Streptomyces finlayi TaxID=67296 RepID=A0A919C740_9ACTN|nr:hypothetical protein [Streptomyces finlayi]GGZ89011.1 hypothetical protein GCM10010329_06660 [Streptomyces spiroverticillatus]GHC79937.1 hypothetical protein GCM10010334_06640 [Streptomyces finlayi]